MKTRECQFCGVSCKNATAYRDHIKKEHPGTKPFSCQMCNKSFGHSISLKRHICNSTTTTGKRENTSAVDNVTRIDQQNQDTKNGEKIHIMISRCRFPQYISFQEELGDDYTDFKDWADAYRTIRLPEDPSLSPSTAHNVQSTFDLSFMGLVGLDMVWQNDVVFCDTINMWLDAQFTSKSLQRITIVNRLRHLRWWGLYMYSGSRTTQSILLWLDDVVHNTQAATSKDNSDASCIALLDPYELAEIRDSIVIALRKQQETCIDTFIEHILRQRILTEKNHRECIEFGYKHLRNWLEIAIRFISVPLRIQCTVNMVEPTTPVRESFVCKLVQRRDRYVRIVYKDKTGSSYQPIEIPLEQTVGYYLTFYRHFCRPDPTSHYTFQTITGSQWIRASRDIKEYMRVELGLEPSKIEPSGRFVHGSRHIMLATFTLAVDFHSEHMRELAFLMRHSTAISEKYYSIWLERNRNERAAKCFTTIMHTIPEQEVEHDIDSNERKQYVPISIRTPNAVIRKSLYNIYQREYDTRFVPIPYETMDQATQTGCEPETGTGTNITDSCTLPICRQCNQVCSILGPFGQSRHRMFGRYFVQCTNCYGKRPHKKTVRWYDIGYVPSTMTRSQKPRNVIKIKEYLQSVAI